MFLLFPLSKRQAAAAAGCWRVRNWQLHTSPLSPFSPPPPLSPPPRSTLLMHRSVQDMQESHQSPPRVSSRAMPRW